MSNSSAPENPRRRPSAKEQQQRSARRNSSSYQEKRPTGSQRSASAPRNANAARRSNSSSTQRSDRREAPAHSTRPTRNTAPARKLQPSKKAPAKKKAIAAAGKNVPVLNKAKSIAATAGQRFVHLLKSSRVALIITIIVGILFVGGLADTLLNLDKAFGGVSVNGIDVSGMNAEQIRAKLNDELETRVESGDVLVYASEKDFRAAIVEQNARASLQASGEDPDSYEPEEDYTYWDTTAADLGAMFPLDEAAEKALAVGRSDGGIFKRLALFFSPANLEFDLNFNPDALEHLAEEIDDAVGDLREDAYIEFEYGYAYAYEGHDGVMVIRDHLAKKLSDAYLSLKPQTYIVAQVEPAPSRISFEKAQATADAINREIGNGALFHYDGKTFHTYAYDLGIWTDANTVQLEDGSYTIKLTIDKDVAVPRLVDELNAHVKGHNTHIQMERVNGEVIVHTSGEGKIPEVAAAVQKLEDELYGENGRVWGDGSDMGVIDINIEESDAPESLTLAQARDLGLVEVIGEYTTYYYNSPENAARIHNVQLAADILDGRIVDSEGGTWRFNTETGPTDTPESGFQAANIIGEGDDYIDDYGGGICQVATTIFNAVYESGLTVTLRAAHTLYQPAYPDGRDAAVSYPDLDFEWRNDFKSDVLLHMSYTDDSVTAQILSVPTGYTVKSEASAWREGAKYGTKFEEDEDLATGNWYISTTGQDGKSIDVTRTIYDSDGSVYYSEVFSSTYSPRDEVVKVGPGTDTSKIKTRDD